MTLPDSKNINIALKLEEKGDPDKFAWQGFMPISAKVGNLRTYSKQDMELAIEKSFNERNLTDFNAIAEEFNNYHLPCMETENKLVCEYYVVDSGTLGGGGRYYSRRRNDNYILMSITFEVAEKELKVRYKDQSCRLTYDDDNRLISYTMRDIELRKKGYSGISSAKKIDADMQKCLNSDLYKTLQHYFRTHYPQKYHQANLGGI